LKTIVEKLSDRYLVTLLPDDQEPVVCLQVEVENQNLAIPFEIPVNSEGLTELKNAVELIVNAFQCGQEHPLNGRE
jgi:hypothetical protein